MCVDSLLLKFNSDEKQFTRLFISVFAFDCILVPPKVVAPCGGGWALQRFACRDRNDHQPPGSSYASDTAIFNHECAHITRFVYSFASFSCDDYV